MPPRLLPAQQPPAVAVRYRAEERAPRLDETGKQGGEGVKASRHGSSEEEDEPGKRTKSLRKKGEKHETEREKETRPAQSGNRGPPPQPTQLFSLPKSHC